jgi:hypothetical protein
MPVDVTLKELSKRETYLGDGLYASFDGYQFKLRAPRERSDEEVFLEPDVLRAFVEFAMQFGYRPPQPKD